MEVILGVTGVPLTYVVRENDVPVPGVVYDSFEDRANACAPLEGVNAASDRQQVHQLLLSFIWPKTGLRDLCAIVTADAIWLRFAHISQERAIRLVVLPKHNRQHPYGPLAPKRVESLA